MFPSGFDRVIAEFLAALAQKLQFPVAASECLSTEEVILNALSSKTKPRDGLALVAVLRLAAATATLPLLPPLPQVGPLGPASAPVRRELTAVSSADPQVLFFSPLSSRLAQLENVIEMRSTGRHC